MQRKTPFVFAVLIDYAGAPLDESALLDFLHSAAPSPPVPKNVSSSEKLIRVTYNTKQEMESVIHQTGQQFENVTIFICQYDPSTYDPMLRSLRQHFKTHLTGRTMDLSDVSGSSLRLHLNYYRDLDFLICFLGVTLRRGKKTVEILSLENNRIRKIEALSRIKIYLPELKVLRLGGNEIEDEEQLDNLRRSAEIEIKVEKEEERESENEAEGEEEGDEEEDDPGRREELAHSVVWTPARSAHPAPVVVAEDPRIACVKPWIDRLIAQSASNIRQTASFYVEDACFSMLFGKLGREWAHLFPLNRNLTVPRGSKVQQIWGNQEIAEKLGELFENGFTLENVTTRVAVVCDLFYAVTIFATAIIDGKTLAMMRSMVVVGHNRRLFIANDVISLRYDRQQRSRPGSSQGA
jgi:hypothetical protein